MSIWPKSFDFDTDEVCQSVFKPFIEEQMTALEAYDVQRPDGHTYIFHEHAARVAENVRRTCLHMGLGDVVARNMYWAVMPHDIGKKSLPVDIWDQEEKPSGAVKAYRRTHTLLGAQIAEELLHDISHPFKDLMIDIMRYHHEQMDGGGTIGVAGDALSMPVRLCAIVEAYDGWRIWRPHYGDRDISPPSVLARMRDEKGAEIFDMDLFESFAEMKMLDYKEGRILQPPP
ncbi:MAG: HD-GYP domain-containing protein [Alphaproteobacteria bacterium]